MKKNWLRICIFISVTLLLFNANYAFAYDTVNEALIDLKDNVELVMLEEILPSSVTDKEEDLVYSRSYCYRFNKEEFEEIFDSKDGTFNIGGKKYVLGFGIEDENGKLISIAEGIRLEDTAYTAGELAYTSGIQSVITTSSGQMLSNVFFEGRETQCYLKLADGSDDEIVASISIGKFEVDETVKYKSKERKKLGLTTPFELAWKSITGELVDEAKRILTETVVSILLSCGDSFLHILSRAVGEVVTIDRIVFGNVNKISIDFFNDFSNIGASDLIPLKAPLTDVINNWYAFFLKIAILFYIVLLIYIGLRIILASTGNRKAEYKTRLVAWTMGVIMLLCFPYVMKYTILANQGLCEWIGTEITDSPNGTPKGEECDIAKKDIYDLKNDYGEYSFVAKAMGFNSLETWLETAQKLQTTNFGNNIMLEIRLNAQMAYSLPLAIVYLIMLGQTLALTILYYKRVFMIAFLITIFPLAAMFYTLNKTGDVKVNSFGAWFKEFLVNVFVQAFHAVTYVAVVTIGISAYRQNGDWMFFILCVFFLFEGEKIIRAIFNAKSSAGTIGDMAAAGAMAWGLLKKTADGVGKIPKSTEKGEDDSDVKNEKIKNKAKSDVAKANQQVNQNTQTQGVEKNKAAAEAAAQSANSNGASDVAGAAQSATNSENTQVKLGREPNTTHEEVFNKVNKRIDERATTTASKAGKVIAGIAGGTAKSIFSYSFAAAQTKDFESSGKAIGVGISGATTGYTSGVKAVDSVHGFRQNRLVRAEGLALADEYLNGDHDDDFVINEADERLRKVKLEAYRKIAARVATERAKHGKDASEKVIINETLDTK